MRKWIARKRGHNEKAKINWKEIFWIPLLGAVLIVFLFEPLRDKIFSPREETIAQTTEQVSASSEQQFWHEEIRENALQAISDESGNIYYSDEQGIWRYTIDALETEFIIPDARLPFINGNSLCYVTAPFTVVRVPLDNFEEKEILLIKQQLETTSSYQYLDDIDQILQKLEVYENLLMLWWHASSLVAYDLNEKRAYELTESAGAEGYVICNDYIYFSEWRDFRVHRVPIQTLEKEPELVVGKDGWWNNENANIYDKYQVLNGHLYFSQRGNPAKLWRFEENGSHRLIYNHPDECNGFTDNLIAYKGKFYFDCSGRLAASPNRVLRCYDPKTGKITIACDDKEFAESDGEINILRDRVFFTKYISGFGYYEDEIYSAPLK